MADFQPKGGMCMACQRRDEVCNRLPFADMPVIRRERDGTAIVRCTEFRQRAPLRHDQEVPNA